MKRQLSCLSISLALALGLGFALLWLSCAPPQAALAQAGTGIIRVSNTHPGSADNPGCGSELNPCLSIQYAVDQAQTGDEIRIAAGSYEDVHNVGGHDQVIAISKNLALRGGYTATTGGWDQPHFTAYTTTIDAAGQGRGIYISDDVTVTAEGLHVTGGNATGQGSHAEGGRDRGGGVYVVTATVTLSACDIYDNDGGGNLGLGWVGGGGGIYAYSGTLTVTNSAIHDNVGSSTFFADGGGLEIDYGHLVLIGNTVYSNTASSLNSPFGSGSGGGVATFQCSAVLSGNKIFANNADGTPAGGSGTDTGNAVTAEPDNGSLPNPVGAINPISAFGHGGGVYVEQGSVILTGNEVYSNTAAYTKPGEGGGLYLGGCSATLMGNRIHGNAATYARVGGWGGGIYAAATLELVGNEILSNTANASPASAFGGKWGYGGGVHLRGGTFRLTGNAIRGNWASTLGEGQGGGIYCTRATTVTLEGNNLLRNSATLTGTAVGLGGALYADAPYADEPMSVTMTNNMVTANHATSQGSGLYFAGRSGQAQGRLLHNTVADNGVPGSGAAGSPATGSGQGIYAGPNTILTLTNNILSGHPEVAILVTDTSTATLEASLWFGNGTDTGGPGQITTGTVSIHGDPAFVDPAAGDYHLARASAGIDAGINAGVTVDYDGESRPARDGYDIGADEVPAAPYMVYLPLTLKGQVP